MMGVHTAASPWFVAASAEASLEQLTYGMKTQSMVLRRHEIIKSTPMHHTNLEALSDSRVSHNSISNA